MTTEEIFTQARAYQEAGQFQQALLCYEFVLKFDPSNPQVWLRMGELHLAIAKPREGHQALHRSIELNPASPHAWTLLGVALRQLGQINDAIAAYKRALALSPSDAEIHNNLGVALQFANEHSLALASYHKAWSLRPDYHLARMREGMIHLLLGNFAEGLPLYEARLDADPGHRRWKLPGPHWSGQQPIKDRHLFIYAEQGFGDTLQFARYIPLLSALGARVTLELQPALHQLVSSSISPTTQTLKRGDKLPDFDFHCPLLSLPHALETRLDSIPPVSLHFAATRRAAHTAQKPRIGFVWAGNPAHTNDQQRSIPLADLMPLLQLSWLTPFVLQKDFKEGDQALLASLPDHENPASGFRDFADTAALLANLDCIITVDTAMAHLAGSLGLPTLLLLSTSPDWRWQLEREDSPWYPSLVLFRQASPGDWSVPLQKAANYLEQHFRKSGPSARSGRKP